MTRGAAQSWRRRGGRSTTSSATWPTTRHAQTEQAILSDDGLGLLKSLAAKQTVDLIGFHSTSWNVPADHPEALFGSGRASPMRPASPTCTCRWPTVWRRPASARAGCWASCC